LFLLLVSQTFVDPNDYSVVRFWICGAHPYTSKDSTISDQASSPKEPLSSTQDEIDSSHAEAVPKQTFGVRVMRVAKNVAALTARLIRSDLRRRRASKQFCLDKVLMAVQTKNEDVLHLRLFQNVPCSAQGHSRTDNLRYLLPVLRCSPLGLLDRVVLLATSAVALGSLALVAPSAYLFASDPSLVFAWCLATSAGAGAAATLVRARYWKTQTTHTNWLRQLVSNRCVCVANFLKIP
uniref:Vezatin domain-containing protein n=1 Tax=Echinostoma caproni TaxID=27848 RepID=A0A183A0T9_9TREM